MRCSSYSETLYITLAEASEITGEDWIPVRGAKHLVQLSNRIFSLFLSFIEIAIITAPRAAIAPVAKLLGNRHFTILNLQVISAQGVFSKSLHGSIPEEKKPLQPPEEEWDKALHLIEKRFLHFAQNHQTELTTAAIVCLIAYVYLGRSGSNPHPESLPKLLLIPSIGNPPSSPSGGASLHSLPLLHDLFEPTCLADQNTSHFLDMPLALMRPLKISPSAEAVFLTSEDMCLVGSNATSLPASSIDPASSSLTIAQNVQETLSPLPPPPIAQTDPIQSDFKNEEPKILPDSSDSENEKAAPTSFSTPPIAHVNPSQGKFKEEELNPPFASHVSKKEKSAPSPPFDPLPYMNYLGFFTGAAGLLAIGYALGRKNNVHIHIDHGFHVAGDFAVRTLDKWTPGKVKDVLEAVTPKRIQRAFRRNIQPIPFSLNGDPPKRSRPLHVAQIDSPYEPPPQEATPPVHEAANLDPLPFSALDKAEEDYGSEAPKAFPLTPSRFPPPVLLPDQVIATFPQGSFQPHPNNLAVEEGEQPPPQEATPPVHGAANLDPLPLSVLDEEDYGSEAPKAFPLTPSRFPPPPIDPPIEEAPSSRSDELPPPPSPYKGPLIPVLLPSELPPPPEVAPLSSAPSAPQKPDSSSSSALGRGAILDQLKSKPALKKTRGASGSYTPPKKTGLLGQIEAGKRLKDTTSERGGALTPQKNPSASAPEETIYTQAASAIMNRRGALQDTPKREDDSDSESGYWSDD